jgi:hypothetical protein
METMRSRHASDPISNGSPLVSDATPHGGWKVHVKAAQSVSHLQVHEEESTRKVVGAVGEAVGAAVSPAGWLSAMHTNERSPLKVVMAELGCASPCHNTNGRTPSIGTSLSVNRGKPE